MLAVSETTDYGKHFIYETYMGGGGGGGGEWGRGSSGLLQKEWPYSLSHPICEQNLK